MTLVEPARRMWLAHRESIRRCIERAAQEARLLLGGGTIAAHRYTSVTITAQQHGIVIETESKEQKRREEYACAEAQHALTETGIAAYVEANHPMAEDELRDAVSRGAEDSLARTTSFSFGMSTLSVSHRPQAKP